MRAIINATVVKPDHYIPEGVILIEDGKIADYGAADILIAYCFVNVKKVFLGGTPAEEIIK